MNSQYFYSDNGLAFIENTPAKRLGELHELDGLILLLSSDASSFISGTAIPIDGGHLISPL